MPSRPPLSGFKIGLLLLLGDVAALVAFLNVAHRLRMGFWPDPGSLQLWTLVALVVVTLYVMNVYRAEFPTTKSRLPLQTVLAVLIGAVVTAIYVYLVGRGKFVPLFGRGVLLGSLVAFAVWAPWLRFLASRWNEKRQSAIRWLCIGDPEPTARFLDDLDTRDEPGEVKVLLTDPERLADFPSNHGHRLLGAIDRLDTLMEERWTAVILAADSTLADPVVNKLMAMRLAGTPVYNLTEFCEKFWLKVPVLHLKDGWFVHAKGFGIVHDRASYKFKRLLDVVLAAGSLVLLSPLMALIVLLVRMESRGPAIYRQIRVGENGKAFQVFKFRSMVRDAEAGGVKWALPNDPRVTRVGRVLRRLRLDELPQIWNVLQGEMSFIGPRPERPEFARRLERTIPYYDLRHMVKPGITGWAQVMYPYGASTEDARQKLQYDLYYIKNHSLTLDLAIVLKTMRLMIWAKGR